MLLLMVVLASPLSAGVLTHEAASGGTKGFDVGETDNPSNPSDYTNPTEVWRKSGFIGRIRYKGPATTFTFTNSGPTVVGAPQNKFYFTRESDPSSWSEFFLVVRLKATRHVDKKTVEQPFFSGSNMVVVQPGGRIEMPYGGGSETVVQNQTWYDRYGNEGTYNGSNEFIYKYPFDSVWMDVTLIRTGNSESLVPYASYMSDITVVPDSATIPLTLELRGSYTGPPIEDAAFLLYDPAENGKLTDFEVGALDDPSDPSGYNNPTEVYNNSGFIGRIAYSGPPTTFTFTNTGPKPNITPSDRFYFTRLSDTNSWREFFLVVRSKGITHNGKNRPDLYGINKVVVTSGNSITIDVGAGFEEAQVGQTGYDSAGNEGTYTGANEFMYKYRYKYVWMDVTLIRTANGLGSLVSNSFYESYITVASDSGASLALALSGKHETSGNTPPIYSFGVTKTVPDPFPISSLIGRTTPATGLKVGMIDYSSGTTKADIYFAADSNGSPTDFYFEHKNNDNITFSYCLAFQPTSPIGSLQQVLPTTSRFRTSEQTVPSPIDSNRTYAWHHLKGDLLIYLPEMVKPASGLYKSTIYCFVSPVY
ncbi:MAG: hypothetical protein GX911_06760 [Spirochaetales bacterium]|nr:hypothetical protein [Spirochaetales bacterium]